MIIFRISNLGCFFFAPKVQTETPYLNSWWITLAKILISFVTKVKLKVYQISDKLVHQELRYGVSDGTFEAKKDQPKLGIRTLKMLTYFPDLSQAFQSHLEKRFQGEGKRIKIEKTIRLRWHHIEDWIGDTDIKVK